jgi:hypothetical protein
MSSTSTVIVKQGNMWLLKKKQVVLQSFFHYIFKYPARYCCTCSVFPVIFLLACSSFSEKFYGRLQKQFCADSREGKLN